MVDNITLSYKKYFAIAQAHIPFALSLLTAIWILNIINWVIFRNRLNMLGLYPRSLFGLVGIVCSPFLHANFNHLFFNSIPLFVLSLFILGLGQNIFIACSISIMLLSGTAVWLVGRKYLHIGASGVISGYFGFILCLAYISPTAISLVLAAVAIYYFGSIFAGIFPTSEKISWESHLIGLLAGIIVGYVFWYHPKVLEHLLDFL